MPYFVVQKRPIFLPKERYEQVWDAALQDWDLAQRGAARIAGPLHIRATNEMYSWLNRLATVAPSKFEAYCQFELRDEQAQGDLPYLLFDWCVYTKIAEVVDTLPDQVGLWLNPGASSQFTGVRRTPSRWLGRGDSKAMFYLPHVRVVSGSLGSR